MCPGGKKEKNDRDMTKNDKVKEKSVVEIVFLMDEALGFFHSLHHKNIILMLKNIN